MKIAMLGQKGIPATYGGIERHVEELSTRLVERGHEVTVYCRPYYSQVKDEYRGVKLVRVPSVPTKHLDTATHCGMALPHILARDYDIVHIHALGPSMFANLPRLRGMRSVVTVHGLDWQREKWGTFAKWVLRRCEYTAVAFPDRTIVVSKALRDYFNQTRDVILTYIPNGTVLPHVREPEKIRELGIDPGNYMLFVGRLVPEKGCHYLLDAYRRLDTDLELIIAGGTSFSTEYVDSLHAKSGERVRFLGYVYGDVLDELYSNARIFVLPSDIEGLPIALLEAMSFGNCCLTSDIPENLEVIGDCGATFRQGDVDDLTARLEQLLANPQRCHAMGDRARRHVLETYDWDGVTLHTEAIYYSLLRGF
ncbi:MAG: glycosyltransferase [Candidatus Eisenbacteria bacterium]|nr:glycosyltransferase [Candidatus Eisenbacteria bacterium]